MQIDYVFISWVITFILSCHWQSTLYKIDFVFRSGIYLFSFVETPRKFIIALCFHKAKQVYCIHHANVQET